MDWKYKHFKQTAVFNAPMESVREAARAVLANSFRKIEDTPDGLVGDMYTGWPAGMATFHIQSVAEGTRLDVELLVKRAAGRGYMLVDVAGYYNSRIDKWFTGISEYLSRSGEQALVSKSTMSYRVQQGCLAGCLVWLVAAACLGVAGTALDHALFLQSSDSSSGPFTIAAGVLAILAGVAAYFLFRYPEHPAAKSIRERLPGITPKGNV